MTFLPIESGHPPVEWITSSSPVPYLTALESMESRVSGIISGDLCECVWLLEHPSVYTAGTSSVSADLLDSGNFEVHRVGRGGQYTYHGPGQRIIYVMLDLRVRRRDVRLFVRSLEELVISSLLPFGIRGERISGRVGIWVMSDPQPPKKIAAIGVRLKKWVSLHGISINVSPDLSHYSGIIPCGIHDYGVTSFRDLGLNNNMKELDEALKKTFGIEFGDVIDSDKI